MKKLRSLLFGLLLAALSPLRAYAERHLVFWVAYNKFNVFVEELAEKVHNLGSDALKVMLTNTAPNAADTHFDTATDLRLEATSNALDLTTANGYTAGGAAVTVTTSAQSGGTYTLAANQVVFTASGGSIGPFQYAALYNNTGGAAATRPLVGWWNYGSALTLNDGESLTIKFNNANPGTILTIA
jgi:hypothetical protein